ncbi:hypothetical protein LEP1GSC040_2431 [Leptospira santarosai str. 2000030832]|nr:hypothetical protein LEP1GSC040_2431 [Leptospira santarosai str. 2000030832]
MKRFKRNELKSKTRHIRESVFKRGVSDLENSYEIEEFKTLRLRASTGLSPVFLQI